VKKKDKDGARQNFHQAIKIKPDFQQALEYLEKLKSQ